MSPRSLQARLVLILLLILLPVLGVGGFFWFWGAKRYLQPEFTLAPLTLAGVLVAVCLLCTVLVWLLVRQQLRPLNIMLEWLDNLRISEYESEPSVMDGAPLELVTLQQKISCLLSGMASDLNRSRQFTADASHELRTPLTILRGETEVALRWAQDPEETRAVLASNIEEIDRMSRIIEDLLLLSKSDVGEVPLQLEQLDLMILLEDLYQQARMLGDSKGVAVSFEGLKQKVLIQGDSLRLRQLFLNLLSNAIKYTPVPGKVQLGVGLLGSLVEIKVTDSGIGIDTRHLPHIFDRFYRVDKARNRADGGSGLGLSIALWVAESHGGSIRVHSTLGQGSEFTVVLPLESSAQG